MGYLRLYLALCVIDSHHIFLPLGDFFILNGRQAVLCFYVLSGFFIALTLDVHKTSSIRSFYWNRVLRVLPAYWAVLACIFIMLLLGFDLHGYKKIWNWQQIQDAYFHQSFSTNLAIIFSSITLLGQDLFWLTSIQDGGFIWQPYSTTPAHNGSSYMLVAPAFTLAIEIYFYLFAPLLQRSRGLIVGMFVAGISYQVGMYMLGGSWKVWGYHVALSSIYYFMLGVVAYHFIVRANNTVGIVVSFGFVVLSLLGNQYEIPMAKISYSITPLLAILVALGYRLGNRQRANILCGYLSYTIYIVHYPVIYYAKVLDIQRSYVWLLILGVALVIHYCIERPAWRLRSRPIRMQFAE